MAANKNVIQSAQIVKGGGSITSDAYVAGATGVTRNLSKGQLCMLVAGTIVPATDSGSEGDLAANAAPFDAAKKYFVSLDDHTADGKSVAVQAVNAETEFEGYVVNKTGADVAMDQTDVGTVCAGYVDANGRLAVNNTTTQGVFVITGVDVTYDPWKNGGDFEKDADGVRHTRVRFKILSAKLLTD